MSREADDPKCFEGRWIDGLGRGCRTCGWRITNAEDPDDKLWLEHDHDPLIDIKERIWQAPSHVPVADAVWLLGLLDPTNWSREAMA